MKSLFFVYFTLLLQLAGFARATNKPANASHIRTPHAASDNSGEKKARIRRAVKLIRGPYLQVTTTTGITIRWRTDVPSVSLVKFGLHASELKKQVTSNEEVTEHVMRIEGLEANHRYFYSIGDKGSKLQGDEGNSFKTLPEAGKTGLFRIAAFGDCGNNSVNQRQVRDEVLKYTATRPLDAWILLGDNAYTDGLDDEFQTKFFDIYKDNLLKNVPLFPCPGNHDYHDTQATGDDAQDTHKTAYYENFSMPVNGESGGVPSHRQGFYSFDLGNIHFLSLDSYGKEDQATRLYDTLGAQVTWVKKDLEANKNKGWIIAYWHHPPYTMGSHDSDHEEQLVKIRENFIKILERYGVDLILCGHSHDYERSKLMNGNYGMETTFNAELHNVNKSSGLYDGSDNACPYIKDSVNIKGTVYVVSGSAGKLGGKQTSFPHNAMYYSDADHGGASMLEIMENRLDFKWICADGQIRDHFTMMKNVNRHHVLTAHKNQMIKLNASFIGHYRWSQGKASTRSIQVMPSAPVSTVDVQDDFNCIKDTFEIHVAD